MRFLIDADLGRSIEAVLQAAGHASQRASITLPPGTSDPEVARYAIAHDQHIVTADRGFVEQLRRDNLTFPYAIITLRIRPTTSPAEAARMFKTFLTDHSLTDGRHYVVEPNRVRITRLQCP